MVEVQRARGNDEPLMVAEGLSKNFGRLTACRDVSFTLHQGEVLAIVGESGSGKTTLLQMLSAQLEPTSGRVSYRMRDGVLRDLNSLGEAERRSSSEPIGATCTRILPRACAWLFPRGPMSESV